MSGYSFNIVYWNTTLHGNVDTLSRLDTNSQDLGSNKEEEVKLLAIQQIEPLPVTAEDIRTSTQRDPTLAKVYQFVLQGWPLETGRDLKPYMDRKDELTIEQDCLMWGDACGSTKEITRESVGGTAWWTHRDHQDEKFGSMSHMVTRTLKKSPGSCEGCLLMKWNPKLAPLHASMGVP